MDGALCTGTAKTPRLKQMDATCVGAPEGCFSEPQHVVGKGPEGFSVCPDCGGHDPVAPSVFRALEWGSMVAHAKGSMPLFWHAALAAEAALSGSLGERAEAAVRSYQDAVMTELSNHADETGSLHMGEAADTLDRLVQGSNGEGGDGQTDPGGGGHVYGEPEDDTPDKPPHEGPPAQPAFKCCCMALNVMSLPDRDKNDTSFGRGIETTPTEEEGSSPTVSGHFNVHLTTQCRQQAGKNTCKLEWLEYPSSGYEIREFGRVICKVPGGEWSDLKEKCPDMGFWSDVVPGSPRNTSVAEALTCPSVKHCPPRARSVKRSDRPSMAGRASPRTFRIWGLIRLHSGCVGGKTKETRWFFGATTATSGQAGQPPLPSAAALYPPWPKGDKTTKPPYEKPPKAAPGEKDLEKWPPPPTAEGAEPDEPGDGSGEEE